MMMRRWSILYSSSRPWSRIPIFTLIDEAIAREVGDDDSRLKAYDEQLRKLRDQGRTLDWLADRARRAVFGDMEAQAMLTSWLDCRPATPSELPGPEHANHTHQASVHDEAVLEFLLPPLIDVLMGTAYASHDDFHALHRRVATIQILFVWLAVSLSFIHRVAQRYLEGIEPAESISFALDELNKGHEFICERPRSVARSRPAAHPLITNCRKPSRSRTTRWRRCSKIGPPKIPCRCG